MSIEVLSNSPLAEALQNVVGPKLAEAGWTSGAVDDNSLTEYIILMLVNGKTQDQIASELAADLLGLPPDEPSTHDFARWLFEQVHMLNAQINGVTAPQFGQQQQGPPVGAPQGPSGFGMGQSAVPAQQDTAMDEGGSGLPEGAVPTGPKSMRNGSTAGNQQRGGARRMLGQLNKAMDRAPGNDAALHRIRGGAATGRINSHGNREPPKGPRSMNNRMQNALNNGGRGGSVAMGMNNPGMPAGMMNADPQQQMQILKLLEEQSRMMVEILGPGAQNQFAPAINPAFFPNSAQAGKSLFDRVDRKTRGQGSRNNSVFQNKKFQPQKSQDAMDTDGATEGGQGGGSGERKDASETVCRWNLSCTNPSCPFGHQSSAAPIGTVLDLSDKCSYGAACTNKKCVASHPSPSQKRQHLATTVDCKFYPNCTNPSCPFKHPTTPPCRNGADCPERDTTCKFSHSDIFCRYNPCLNPSCPYRHTEGQKKGNFSDKVWTAEGFDRKDAEKAHLSERQFIAGEGEEELILPGRGQGESMDVEGGEGRDSATQGRASPESLGQADIVT